MNPEFIMPPVVLWIVWAMRFPMCAPFPASRDDGVASSQQREHGAKSSTCMTTPSDHPVTHWALPAFYWLTALFVPIATLYVLASWPRDRMRGHSGHGFAGATNVPARLHQSSVLSSADHLSVADTAAIGHFPG